VDLSTICDGETSLKTMPEESVMQPCILEQGLGLINQGLSQITQALAVNM